MPQATYCHVTHKTRTLHNLYIGLGSSVIIATKLLAERPGLVPDRGEELLFPQRAIGPVTKCAQ